MADVQDAASPFDDRNADVIFRSSDDIDFHVHKSILSFASPFFHDLFTLPCGPPITQNGSTLR